MSEIPTVLNVGMIIIQQKLEIKVTFGLQISHSLIEIPRSNYEKAVV